MACSRGKAHPDAGTRLRLFTDSAGFCQNPDCNGRLFPVDDAKHVHIAEMAHIFAASDDGPRAKAALTEVERGLYENIILLCANCHKVVDKIPDKYPDGLIRNWKLEHAERINAAFGIKKFKNRPDLRIEIVRLLEENKEVHEMTGPDLDYRSNPEAPEADMWKARVRSTIIPNNNLLIRILDANLDLLDDCERKTVAKFKMHVKGLVLRHIEGMDQVNIMFPKEMECIGV